jgi:AcrR family transcriptional regulator
LRRGDARKRILDAARVEFGANGFAGARVDRVATRAGVNKQLIYYYFTSKQGLYREAAGPGDLAGALRPAKGQAGPEAFRHVIRDLFAELEARPELVSLLVERNPAQHPLARQWANSKIDAIATLVSQGQGTGYFRDDIDPKSLAQQAIVICSGFHALGHHMTAEPEAWLTAACDTLLRGMAW